MVIYMYSISLLILDSAESLIYFHFESKRNYKHSIELRASDVHVHCICSVVLSLLNVSPLVSLS